MGMMMVVSFVIAPIGGILLALRFKVFVLVPATLLAAVVIIASSHQPKLTIALTVVGTAVLLQIGYIVGLIARALCKDGNGAAPAIPVQPQPGALVHGGRSARRKNQ